MSPSPVQDSAVLLWIIVPVVGVCIAVIGYFLRQVFTQIKEDRTESSIDRKGIFDSVNTLNSKFDERLEPIRREVFEMKSGIAQFKIWADQHEKFNDASHADHGRQLEDHRSRIAYLERGARVARNSDDAI